ncbi:lysozyme inhibitor LprI family protein [Caulobacter segnis]|uniref:lysozyme inhibitor LprI family protein n=1 Tax=Caulobacter segnis TaxID=88688 RepID=UPI0024105235|nr:lysozyme inhibitor LprI family protein [Caulobacter segnis]MDG2522541.1 lysozyme inhibitor LprI family protein [Caulobacter segnis]
MIGLLLSLALGAAEIDPKKEYSPALDACLAGDDAARGVSVAMATCFNEERGRQDARLNAAYKAVMARRSPGDRNSLRDVQRAWIKRRDAECEENLTGGTIDMVERAACHLELTAMRAVELERLAR